MRTLKILAACCSVLAFAAVVTAQPGGPGSGTPEGAWEHFSERHDLDGDGAVTAEEFAASDPRFDSLDQNGDGTVTRDDFEILHQNAVSAGASRVVRLADADRDHAISSEEWRLFLEAVDSDGDGLFEPADLRAVVAERFGGRPGGGKRFGGRERGGMDRHGDGLTSVLDQDQDGELEIADLDSIFNDLDKDGDGALQAAELPAPPRGGRHHGPRGFRRGGMGEQR